MDDSQPYIDVPVLWVIPSWALTLSNLYWRLRSVRRYHTAGRRMWYRYIRLERDYLEGRGIDSELIRLACRYLKNPVEGPALDRLRAYEIVVAKLRYIQGLPMINSLAIRNINTFYPDLLPEFRTKSRQSARVWERSVP